MQQRLITLEDIRQRYDYLKLWGNTLQQQVEDRREEQKIEDIKETRLVVNTLVKRRIKKRGIKTYLMKDSNTGMYKIGMSTNPKFREKTLQSEKPTISMVKVWNEDIEKELHEIYKYQRVRGEWFILNKIQVRYICTHY